MLIKQRSWVIFLLQVMLVVSSICLAWLLRFEFCFKNPKPLLLAIPVLVLIRVIAMARFNLYHGYWRYTGLSDAADIFKAVAIGSAVFFIVLRWVFGVTAFPLSVYLLEAMLTGIALGGVRVLSRAVTQAIERHQHDAGKKTTLVVGVGAAGVLLESALQQSNYTLTGFVDDDRRKVGVNVRGVPVLGTINDLPQLVRAYRVDEVLIAIPSATGKQMQRIVDYCTKSGARFRTIPSVSELVDGRVTVGQLREVNLDDLLGRDPIRLDVSRICEQLKDRVVLVTGAAGSIGSELCRQIVKYKPAKLVCVDQAETPLFYVQLQLTKLGSPAERICYHVADITDSDRMRAIIADYGVTAIFHAAAYKHVPLMEENLSEALKNNVFGLVDLLNVAQECGCKDFLLISSDKAVNPSSFMGCTKRLGELILAARQKSGMRCVSVRFGNVLGSQGSVIPEFQEQIRNDRQITVTHPDITRYFMTIPEAAALVLQGFAVGEPGDILVLDMGEPVRIVDLARSLIKMSGMKEDGVKIVYTGLRPGEKLFEELFYSSEKQTPTIVDKVWRTRSRMLSWPELQQGLDRIRVASSTSDEELIRSRETLIKSFSAFHSVIV
ncbi:MAG: polysaccharide biosynthesis protein [Acidobacteria bacterium]|nr:MAG: polysaccharide biosynthesis protein [Acidobacteriota bacterium]